MAASSALGRRRSTNINGAVDCLEVDSSICDELGH